jgi:hypothetical protein
VQTLVELDQFPPRQGGIACGVGHLLRGSSQAEQRQKQTANAQLETGNRLAWQVQSKQRQQHNQTQSNVMRPS